MEAPSDNSRQKNLTGSLPHTEGGIVIDIGTGDGRFVSAMARQHPDKFFIGVDANVKPLEKASMRATRKPAKGGLKNALFVQAAVEDLPTEFDGVANEIHIHFPWGSLLGAVATGNGEILAGLRRIASYDCALEIIFGIDSATDGAELERLRIPEMSPIYLHSYLIPKYLRQGSNTFVLGVSAAKKQAGLVHRGRNASHKMMTERSSF